MPLLGWDIGPYRNKPADALIHHARYNETLLAKTLHPDTKFITLVREAIPWFQSAVKFWPYQVQNKVSGKEKGKGFSCL